MIPHRPPCLRHRARNVADFFLPLSPPVRRWAFSCRDHCWRRGPG
jgi:hypothetical protein